MLTVWCLKDANNGRLHYQMQLARYVKLVSNESLKKLHPHRQRIPTLSINFFGNLIFDYFTTNHQQRLAAYSEIQNMYVHVVEDRVRINEKSSTIIASTPYFSKLSAHFSPLTLATTINIFSVMLFIISYSFILPTGTYVYLMRYIDG